MKISEIITDKYKLRMTPTAYFELLADVVEVEEDQVPMSVIEDIKAEIMNEVGEYKKYWDMDEAHALQKALEIIDKHCGKGTDE